MSTAESSPTIRRSDYRPPDHLIARVNLDIRLVRRASEILARLGVKPHPQGVAGAPLILHRDEVMPARILLDGRALRADEITVEARRLILHKVPDRPFTLDLLNIVDAEANTTLNGLYLTNDVFCTQCEAEGFRRITPFIDRPDVLARYRTRIEARKSETRYLLANGNPLASGDLAEGRHFALWDDPWPKPSYLFALVAGNLARVSDTFLTRSGREVRLDIFVEDGKEDRCAFAMESLKRAMSWDEQAFGREYDLDVFMLVAVGDFNMGAMENKGLNIFNDKYVLADPRRATDGDFIDIEAIIGHEYFHNWTGNRITCRDWFQLCVKEGLTVFRDQEFTAAMRSPAVKRIMDVRRLRSAQFVEDQGPLAHPVRPNSYKEINNFYTATVYEKGAEIIRMLRTLIGEEHFSTGMTLYFERHDGQAVTVEDFITCFAETSGRDLAPFMRWYAQAGTPVVSVDIAYDAVAQTATLAFKQTLSPAAGDNALPQTIPVHIGLLDPQGRDMELHTADGAMAGNVIILDEATCKVTFHRIEQRPVPSLLRGFSAPVRLDVSLSDDDLVFLLTHDSDSFNRWQAGQTLATRQMAAAASGRQIKAAGVKAYLHALAQAIEASGTDDAFLALLLTLPSESDIAREIGTNIDPEAIHIARRDLRRLIGLSLREQMITRYAALPLDDARSMSAMATARRSLRNALLDLLCAQADERVLDMAQRQFRDSQTMTEVYGALIALSQQDCRQRSEALAAFHDRHQGDALVIDKWLAVQAMVGETRTLRQVEELTRHPAFRLTNPNRVRALLSTFAFSNPSQFNRRDGAGYRFIADQVMALDRVNPQVAARLATAFRAWAVLEPGRRQLARQELERIAACAELSPDLAEMVHRTLDI